MWPRGAKAELLAAFPNRTIKQLEKAAQYYGVRKARRRFKATGYEIIDQIRERCFELGYSMIDVDEISKTKRYFSQQRWHADKRVDYKAAAKAIAALDGKIAVAWND